MEWIYPREVGKVFDIIWIFATRFYTTRIVWLHAGLVYRGTAKATCFAFVWCIRINKGTAPIRPNPLAKHQELPWNFFVFSLVQFEDDQGAVPRRILLHNMVWIYRRKVRDEYQTHSRRINFLQLVHSCSFRIWLLKKLKWKIRNKFSRNRIELTGVLWSIVLITNSDIPLNNNLIWSFSLRRTWILYRA